MSQSFRVCLNVYMLIVFVGIGGLQMYRIDAGVWTSYGADLLAPPAMYLSLRSRRKPWAPTMALTVLLAGCVAWEWLQRYDLSGTPLAITRGTFDPWDLASYAVGLLICFVIDRWWLQPRGILTSPDARS